MNTPHTLLQSLQQLLDYHDGSSAEPISRNEAVEHARQTLDAAEVRLRANFNRILRETLEELNAAHAASWMEIKAANDTLQLPTSSLVLVPVSDIIAEIVKANLVYRLNGENTCHSHEYVDANQVFIDAFEETYAEEFDPQNDLHQHLYHQGWVIEPDEPEKPEPPITAKSGWVVQQPDGRKYVVGKPHEIDLGAVVIADRPHGDGDYSYTCGSEYCKCCS